ncbi:hypothetical protein EMPS_07970 [Entomortierella parvispora]|uniref:Tyrosine specific protein phosphatases domain-containing protein n=1 Tax=Entomortierella parvispora TaxID=205924 RepID=A0A9P3HFE0_9FUNG|nr:hypothetical protein EMPS_07970 [Entomortierella parvispora]
MEDSAENLPLDLILDRAAAAFKDADFFESGLLFWTAVLDPRSADDSAQALALALDLEQELGLDVQAEDPIELSYPPQPAHHHLRIHAGTISAFQTHVVTALCYLARHINVRIDILPSGQDTLTSMGPPQRVYGSLTDAQKETYQDLLAIILATSTELTLRQQDENEGPQEQLAYDRQLEVQQNGILGNEATRASWQAILPQKHTPHSLPRFFSFLNSSSCTVAGCSVPRNEQDIDALHQVGFNLVISLMKESPLPPSWFHKDQVPKSIKNAYVPIENRKAPSFPEVFEVLMGWCVRTGNLASEDDEGPFFDHQRATLIHCGGGKGRAGIVLAAHLIRFGLVGHERRGYCRECIRQENVHPFDLEQFRRGLGDQETAASSLPDGCLSASIDGNESEDDDAEDEEPLEYDLPGVIVARKQSQCLNRFEPMMPAKDAMVHLRNLRPGSIETTEQEKSIKAYSDWLWKRSSLRASAKAKSAKTTAATSSEHQDLNSTAPKPNGASDRTKGKKNKTKDNTPKHQPATHGDGEEDNLSDDDFDRGRKSGKKGKKGKQMPHEEPKIFVPPPADKIIRIPGSGKGSHHQHHLVVQHNMRARQLQRGQKSKKGGGNNNKNSKERPSFSVTGSPLDTAPKLVILTGLPGSGKSHVVTTLLQEYPEHFVRISQDELGSRAVCERLLAQSMRHQQQSLAIRGPKKALPMTIFVDRCNPTMAQRKEWYEVAFQPDEAAMVWFSLGLEKCVERVDSREGHPTVAPGMGGKVVRSFAKGFEFPNLSKENSWCKTLVEVGDDDGSDQLLDIFRAFAQTIPGSSKTASPSGEATVIKARPAFIPARVLQRKNIGPGAGLFESGPSSGHSSSNLPLSGGMESVEEESDEEDEEEEADEEESEGSEDEQESDEQPSPDEADETMTPPETTAELEPAPPSTISITKALQFAALTGQRPAVKKPAKGSWNGTAATSSSDSKTTESGAASPKGVSFAPQLSTFDRPLQKFPRTPHLFDPLTILESWQQETGHALQAPPAEDVYVPDGHGGRSMAISRSDLLLPASALRQVFAPKAHQVLTVEEKMDGANIGFSVLHFKGVMGFAGSRGENGSTTPGPPPKIRVQNRNHFVHPDDHWQFKKLNSWLENHREDILWLCEGGWRYGNRKKSRRSNGEGEEDEEEDEETLTDHDAEESSEEAVEVEEGVDDGDWEDEEESEYVDEDTVLQDGMAPYVLYGEWLYAKHSVQYTGLRSWFIPFDLFDVKTGTFVSRQLFHRAIGQTKLVQIPTLTIPKEVYGDVEKTLLWTLQKLHSRSILMRPPKEDVEMGGGEDKKKAAAQSGTRVEGLYFRIDQGDRLLTRCKVVRPDFIAGEERWGTKEQVANQILYN